MSGLTGYLTKDGIDLSYVFMNIEGRGVTLDSSNNAVFNDIICNGGMFGRNDTGPNTFSGVLGFTQHPIGWTITASKTISSFSQDSTINVITVGTPITVFDNLSNGVWMFGAICNNDPQRAGGAGLITYLQLSYGGLTGGTAINGDIGSLFHRTQNTSGLGIISLSYPTLIIRTSGNRTTRIIVNMYAVFSSQPTMIFNMYATKIA